MKIFAVIDTNVIVSTMLKADSVPGKIISLIFDDRITPLLHRNILKEYDEVLRRKKFNFNNGNIDRFIELITEHGVFLDPAQIDEYIPDKKDVIFYEITMEKRKTDDAYLVTGNIKHFPSKSFVVTPKEMLDIITEAENDEK